jgi:hypothetical protein
MPTGVSDTPQILSLEELLSGKLSTYMGHGARQLKHLADVVELITRV